MATKLITWFKKERNLLVCRNCGYSFKAPAKRSERANHRSGFQLKYPKGTWTTCPNGCTMVDLYTKGYNIDTRKWDKPWSVLKVCTHCPLYKQHCDCQKE